MPTPLPTLAGVYYCYVFMTFQTRRVGSTFTFKTSSPPADEATDLQWSQFIADALPVAWNTEMIARYPTGTAGTDARVYALGHPLLPAATAHVTGAGAQSGAVAAVSAAAVIGHQVRRRGRGSQGHTAISPLCIAEIDGGGTTVTDAFVTNVTEDFENFIADVQAAWAVNVPATGLAYVQLSRVGSGATYPIESSQVEKLLGTERSRTPRP